eukprot:TRINITY_DN608_c0_g1_i1.p1 TRINITY_DN608_c0_g1~~TRINITY_DN608_c0_g1_i1.p1  ORF type:complete len:494 (+),score=81.24 TRINITY_DN608_c0_g1_i1:68-1549(+)
MTTQQLVARLGFRRGVAHHDLRWPVLNDHWFERSGPCKNFAGTKRWKFLNTKEICLRAVDSSNNHQPEHPNWNVTGMLNNCWYRVQVEVLSRPNHGPRMTFHHPVRPGELGGGWMVTKDKEPKPERTAVGDAWRPICEEELAKHTGPKDAWVAIDGMVYDLSDYLEDHPGGPAPILAYAGKDSTEAFNSVHVDPDAREGRSMFCIGMLVSQNLNRPRGDHEFLLKPGHWEEVELAKKEIETLNTRRFTFRPLKQGLKVGLPVGNHLLIGANFTDDNTTHLVSRPYSPVRPVRTDEDDGTFDLVVKIYFAGESPAFPQGGKMSQHLESLKVGDKVLVKGPDGHVLYKGCGRFTIGGVTIATKRVALIAGGTGLTPMVQLIRSALSDKSDETKLSLLYSNRTVDDILMRNELDQMAAENPDRFTVWYTVSTDPEGKEWKFSVGHVDEELMHEHLFSPPDASTIAFLCGPPAMIDLAAIPGMEKLGYVLDVNMFEF